ncbi:MAG: thioesterase family protein [Deferribacterota bacterium]|nr:thioesterase family protein [Deferribacterota bacterium]
MKKYRCPVQVRFVDLDGYFHVNHANYVSYLEIARISFFREHLDDFFTTLYNNGILILLRKLDIKYVKSIGLYDNIFVEMWVKKVKNIIFTFKYNIVDDNKNIYSIAETELAVYDNLEKKPTKIPKSLLEVLYNYLEK